MQDGAFTLPHFAKWVRRLELDNGEPFVLEPYQERFVEDVFSGVPESWLVIPQGNGKTTLVAALVLYHIRFTADACAVIAASSRDQARITYRQAKGFILRSRLDEFKCFDGYRRIDCAESRGYAEVFAADDRTGDGIIPTLCVLDELHRHRSLDLYETWRGKLNKRAAQLVAISTAGEPGSEFEVARENIRERLELKREGRTFIRAASEELVLHEYAVPENGNVEDLELVAEANPASFVTVALLRKQRRTPTLTLDHWRRFTCNQPMLGESVEPFVQPSDWARLADGEAIVGGESVCLGADGSRTWDTTVVAWASQGADGRVDVDARVFSVERPNAAAHVFHKGGKIDFDDVESFIVDRFEMYDVLEAAYDPRYLDRSMEIVETRLPEACVFAVEPQSKHMRDALQTLFTLVAEGKLRHLGDPVVAAHLANASVERGHGSEIRRVRKIDQRKPIDAVPAIAMAIWRAAQGAPVSVYETREALAV